MFSPNQDVIYQEVKLFIEGVQVPFTSIQVTSGIGQLPSATISIPPFPGLMDICRYYQPKVHIFYVDPTLEGETKLEEKNKRECVLFIGHIAGVNFSKSRTGGYSQITFYCNHKNAVMADVLVDYTDPTSNTQLGKDPTQDNSTKMSGFSSEDSIIQALYGINSPTPLSITASDAAKANANETARLGNYPAPPTDLSIELKNSDLINANPASKSFSKMNSKWATTEYLNRYKGFPGVLMNLWNQLKLGPVRRPDDFESMISLYLPLIENGIKFFDRLSGHYYIESLMDNNKVQPCDVDIKGVGKDSGKHLAPPCTRLFVQSSAQSQIAVNLMQNRAGWSTELTDFLSMFKNLLESIDYDYITLTSPAESAFDPANPDNGETQALETIIKPETPFYYSPACNVYYPYMYHTINIQQDEASIPTRITLYSKVNPTSADPLHKNYRSPYSIREAIVKGYSHDMDKAARAQAEGTTTSDPNTAPTPPPKPVPLKPEEAYKIWEGQNLLSSTDGIKNKTRVGKFEFGRGIRHRKYAIPYWLSMYSAGKGTASEMVSMSPADKLALNTLLNAWNYRFGEDKAALNPYSPESQIAPNERLLFSAADYRYTKEVASSKAGSLSGIFNPYIIPGYPMDIMDPSPVNPCFHAMCASVTHNITASSISTDVSFVAAITYTELANYYLQYLNPWMQIALKIVAGVGDPIATPSDPTTIDTPGFSSTPLHNSTGLVNTTDPTVPAADPVYQEYTSSIVQNPEAAKLADELFYYPTLGIGSLAPDDLYDFETGTLKSIEVSDSIRHGAQREENPMLSAQGNLLLVSRPIETREKIEIRFGLKFIDMEQNNYNPNVIKYTDEILDESTLLEPGQSQFLRYSVVPGMTEDTTSTTDASETTTANIPATAATIATTATTTIKNAAGNIITSVDLKPTVGTNTLAGKVLTGFTTLK